MCGCEAHWKRGAPCTCTCSEHLSLRLAEARYDWLTLGVRLGIGLVLLAFVIYWLAGR